MLSKILFFSQKVLELRDHLYIRLTYSCEPAKFRKRKFQCPDCDKSYKYPCGLYSHRKHECGAKIFQCPVCSRSYKYAWNLTAHRKYECGIEPKFNCLQCPYKAKRKRDLMLHMGIKHGRLFTDN
ncbi:hypothetical protein O3M35_011210 [Rhynocoris fuscipes]|uniref:C2H2-type domain-containing protein n=1 Tax=Rhynocoris fuscipes TaxID=488301 RepID=A0AAW1CZW4_9HEMI